MDVNPRAAVRTFLTQLLRQRGDTAAFSDSELLLTGGRLDSLAAIDVVVFLERQFGIDFSAGGFDAGQIDSIDNVMTLLAEPVQAYS
jgi:acyl carrier protein